MIQIDEESIFNVVKSKRPRSVALNGPEPLLPKIQKVSENIEKEFGIISYIIGDRSWGSCDLNTQAADMLGADILFNIGHTISLENFGEKVFMINAFDTISFDKIALKCANELKGRYKTISLVTDSQHLHQIETVRRIFEKSGYNVELGKGKGQLNDAQVFGCEFHPLHKLKDNIEAFIFLGQSRFHSIGVALSTEKPTFMLDPYFEEFTQINKEAEIVKKRAILSVYKALDARTIGIIIGLKEGQFANIKALEFRKELKKLGINTQLLAMTEISNERLENFREIDAFVQVACPRLGTDNFFSKPILSVPQALALIKLLKKEPVEEFFRIQHWL
ncbi:MAG TPA: diphthamide biosynthesis enzyme Dph2 [Candidatus Nitrosocosmicus sp.]|nr:diphthamide biosynthesis enzyme Dph2 [Candidatus Nitrosocosmicus sp.]